MPVFYDAKALVRAWINSQTATLIGVGKPLQLGAHLAKPRPLRSPSKGAIAYLSNLPGSESPDLPEAPMQRARISAQIYASTQEAVDTAAAAYMNALIGLRNPPGGVSPVLRFVTDIAGPNEVPDGDWPRVVVDADFWIS